MLAKSLKSVSNRISQRYFTSTTSVYDGRSLWDIFPRMPKEIIVGDITIRDGFQHEEVLVSTDAKKYYLEQSIYAGCKNIEITNLGSPKVMPQFHDMEEIMKFAKGGELENKCNKKGINFNDITFTTVTIREYAVDMALEFKQKGYGPDRCLMMVSTDETHHSQNSGLSLKEYWVEAESSIKKCNDEGIKMCGTVSTIWGSPCGGGYPTDMNKAVEFVEKWFDLGAYDVEHADHDGSAAANEVYDYFTKIMNKFEDSDITPSRHICHFHETKRGVSSANLLAALMAGVNHFECTLGGIGGQPSNWLDDKPVRGTGAYYYKDADPRYVGLLCLEDVLVQIDEMGLKHNYNIDLILKLGKQVERTLGRRLRSDAIRNGRTPHKIGKNEPLKEKIY
eukprot:89516_1